jgi:hypothetical protein
MIKKYQVEILKEALCLGLNITDSCNIAGISRESFYKRIEENKKFKQVVEATQITCKKQCLRIIRDAAIKNWRAAAWLLERKYPKEFGLDRCLEIGEENEKLITIRWLTQEENQKNVEKLNMEPN